MSIGAERFYGDHSFSTDTCMHFIYYVSTVLLFSHFQFAFFSSMSLSLSHSLPHPLLVRLLLLSLQLDGFRFAVLIFAKAERDP